MKTLLTTLLVLGGAFSTTQTAPLLTFDKPFLFAYGSWDKKATIDAGVVRISGTPKGGAGVNLDPVRDWSSKRDMVPSITVRVGQKNPMRSLKLLLGDTEENMATYTFALPESGSTTLTPVDGASLGEPFETSKGKAPDLKRVMQWQLGGDWSSDLPIDIQVLSITATAPNATILAARKSVQDKRAAEQREQAEQARQRRETFGKLNSLSPKVQQVYFAGPDMVALEIVAGKVQLGWIEKYQPQPGDTVAEKQFRAPMVVRSGKEIGYLLGKNRDEINFVENYSGDPLLDEYANDPKQFTLSSTEDPAYATPLPVKSVARKTKPIDAAMPSYEMVLRHRLYLALPANLKEGKKYRLNLGKLNAAPGYSEFVYAPGKTWSEAIRVSQIGFRPDDPVKRSFMSLWLGTGGGYSFKNKSFQVIEASTGKSVFQGAIIQRLGINEKEKLYTREENFAKTAVYHLDFSGFKTPGTYKIYVPGVGVSDPFPIASDVWDRAFKIQMRGLLHNRSGVELAAPFSSYKKPRDMHPADGQIATLSKYTALDGPTEGDGIVKGDTGVKVPGAWGGYHDAGDWNPRRVSHLEVTYNQLLLMKMFPQKFAGMKWNIPAPIKAPDILNEALWELDCFRRIQQPDGGLGHGIETNGDPNEGEVSWRQTFKLYVFGSDPVNSWRYVPGAILFSQLVQPYDPALAKTFRESALKAMTWAEENRPRFEKKFDWTAKDARNLAAAWMFAETRDPKYDRIFRETTCLTAENPNLYAWGTHWQGEGAFAYSLLPAGIGDAGLKLKAKSAFEGAAKLALNYAANNSWNLTTSDQGKPMINGFFSSPHAQDLVRAHFLTQKPEYLAGIVQSSLFCGGANPQNATYTTGVGTRSVMAFKIDSRRTGQPTPEGLTIYGNADIVAFNGSFHTWPIQWHISRVAIPNAYEWPIPEMLFETYLYPGTLEYTVDAWSPNVLVWGYLAARK